MIDYWDKVQYAAGMGGHYHWVLLACFVTAFALGAIAPAARPLLRVTIFLIFVSFLAMLVSGLLLHRHQPDDGAASFRYIHFGSQLLFAMAVVNLAGVRLFRVLLPPIRLQPPPILRDTILGLAFIVAGITLLSRME